MSPKILFISLSPICLLWFCFISRLPDLRAANWLPLLLGYMLPYPHLLTKGVTQRMRTLYSQRFPAMTPWSSLAWTNLCDQAEWMGWFTFPISYTSSWDVTLNGQPRPRAYRKGEGTGGWERNPQKSTVAAPGISVCLRLINCSSQTSPKQCAWWQQEENGEKENSNRIIDTACWDRARVL